jgi:hypothetical protein
MPDTPDRTPKERKGNNEFTERSLPGSGAPPGEVSPPDTQKLSGGDDDGGDE